VFCKEDPSLPRIAMQLNWLGGANSTPLEELAPFVFAGDLLEQGGTAALSPQELEVRIDELGMQFSCGIGGTQSYASFWSLSRNFDEAFGLAVDILTEPRLDAERLEVLKAQHAVSMKRRFDSPRRGVGVLANQVLYEGQPRRSHVTSKAEAEAVSTADVRQVVDRYLGPDNLFITVVGDFETESMLARIEEKLGGWSQARDSERIFLKHAPVVKPGVFLVEKDLPQPAIRIVQEVAVDRTAPAEEHAAMEIMNDILGGSGFRSRLMERLRSDEGLTYGIYSRFQHEGREGFPGQLTISYQTRKDAVLHSIESVLEVYTGVMEEGATEAEVAEQIQTWRNTFIFRFENEFYSVARLMGQELDDRPYDFDQTRLAAIQAVSKADVDAAARKILNPENLSIFIFGSLAPEDEAAIAEKFGLTKLDKEVVFAGGF
jgi:zinc protease